MSGTSLDGLDLALVEFSCNEGVWSFDLIKADTIVYEDGWQKLLAASMYLSGEDLLSLDVSLGKFIGESVLSFLSDVKLKPCCIASHGHTVFHQPDKGFTSQIGDGYQIAAITQIDTVYDFRKLDVAMGGQGAPLVPVGDRLLFGTYDYCLNIGGFANISYEYEGDRIAYDICPANIILNALTQEHFQQAHDTEGRIGRRGNVHKELLRTLENISFYKEKGPKSLGKEWLDNFFTPVLKKFSISAEDMLRTLYEHFASRIAHETGAGKSLFVTGGGAHNKFLIECIKRKSGAEIVVPDHQIVNYKEAIIFALLGILRIHDMPNTLASATGAKSNSIGGSLIKISK